MARFEPDYFNKETRCGFEIDSMMKRCWANELELLELLDKICKKMGIKYFVDWGTLLGTVRHKGFIPWDDDIDVCMKRSDFNRFVNYANKKLPKNIRVNSIYSKNNFRSCAAYFTDVSDFSFNAEYLKKHYGFPFKVGIDIFPIDELPTNQGEYELIKSLSLIIRTARDCFILNTDNRYEYLNLVEDFTKCKIDQSKDIPAELTRLYEKFNQLYAGSGGRLANIELWSRMGDITLSQNVYDEVIYLPFEDTLVPAPAKYDEILTAYYGDYMTPVRGTASHNYPFYKEQEAIINKQLQENNLEPIINFEYTMQMILALDARNNILNDIRIKNEDFNI